MAIACVDSSSIFDRAPRTVAYIQCTRPLFLEAQLPHVVVHTFQMRFSLCCCLKRDRASYSISDNQTNHNKSNAFEMPVISAAPTPVSSATKTGRSTYAKIIHSSETPVADDHRNSTLSVKTIQPVSDDYAELYATIDPTKYAKNRVQGAPTSTDVT